MHLTPEMLEGSYNLLLTTPPFRGWKLPPSDDVTFSVVATRGDYATHTFDATGHKIEVSYKNVHQLGTLIEKMAHEMCHMREVKLKVRRDVGHGHVFNKLADQVCRHHKFDRGAF